jgi:hypothetical protein
VESLRQLRCGHGFRRSIGVAPKSAEDPLPALGVGELAENAAAVPAYGLYRRVGTPSLLLMLISAIV